MLLGGLGSDLDFRCMALLDFKPILHNAIFANKLLALENTYILFKIKIEVAGAFYKLPILLNLILWLYPKLCKMCLWIINELFRLNNFRLLASFHILINNRSEFDSLFSCTNFYFEHSLFFPLRHTMIAICLNIFSQNFFLTVS